MGVQAGVTGLARCTWALGHPAMQAYHDDEWGVPQHDDRTLFEFVVLEGAQAGLSWRTVLDKREGYRRAFANFDIDAVAGFDAGDVARLLADPGIVRNRAKVSAAVGNAVATQRVRDEFGSFDAYLWSFVDGRPVVNHAAAMSDVPASSPVSDRMSKDMRRRGYRFAGTTICYAIMQACGLVNDHLVSCFRHPEVQQAAPG